MTSVLRISAVSWDGNKRTEAVAKYTIPQRKIIWIAFLIAKLYSTKKV